MDKSAVVFHIPHSSTHIPDEYLIGIVMSEEELRQEVVWSTDMYCDELFDTGFGMTVKAPFSRLACDVERFRDDSEELFGQGLF